MGFEKPTPIQEEAFPIAMSGKNIVGIAQTGTGKTLAYMLPILQQFKFSKDYKPKAIILVPTRELVVQVVEQIELFTKYMTTRVLGVYGGVNIKTQMGQLTQGVDIVVGTPGRLYDLAANRSLLLQNVKKLVIDEVDVMLDLGFRFQLNNIFELNVRAFSNMNDGLKDVDVILMLRIQKERMSKDTIPSEKEYFKAYGLNEERLKFAKNDCIVLHPGPINRGVEIDTVVADGRQSVILEQVKNGIGIRMAVMEKMAN